MILFHVLISTTYTVGRRQAVRQRVFDPRLFGGSKSFRPENITDK